MKTARLDKQMQGSKHFGVPLGAQRVKTENVDPNLKNMTVCNWSKSIVTVRKVLRCTGRRNCRKLAVAGGGNQEMFGVPRERLACD